MKAPTTCHLCSKEISTAHVGSHYKKHHPEFDYISYKNNCNYCGCGIKSGKCCSSKECKLKREVEKTNERFKNSIEGKDYVKCPICGFKGVNLCGHYRIKHKLTYEEYHNLYPDSIHCKNYLDFLSERIKGNKNPGYQHGGRLSPHSPKFKKYIDGSAEYTIEDIQKKKIQTVKDNPQNQPTKIEFWLAQGLSEEDAKKALSQRQTTFSKEICIEKYGEEKGLNIWNNRQEKWQENINSKPQEEINRINKLKVLSGNHVSKNELEIFNHLKEKFEYIEPQFILRDENGYRLFDMCINKTLIEYNGDYWHCNPELYKSDFINKRLNKSAKAIWDRDLYKRNMANKLGYNVYTIWEKDYNTNKQKTLQECVNYLTQ